MALHSGKVLSERDAFLDELFETLPSQDSLRQGKGGARSQQLHKLFLPLHLLKHYKEQEYLSPYDQYAFSYAIEAESLLLLGFKVSGLSALRGALDCAFKFLYYEYHPVENQNHLTKAGKDLSNIAYRDFAYSFPGMGEVSAFASPEVEQVWTELCRYTHGDTTAVDALEVVGDLCPIMEYHESDFQSLLALGKRTLRLMMILLLAAHPDWASKMEKLYFESLWGLFSPDERLEIQHHLAVE